VGNVVITFKSYDKNFDKNKSRTNINNEMDANPTRAFGNCSQFNKWYNG
jgi:hypothetical protein